MIQHSGIGTHVRGLLEGFQKLGTTNKILLLGDPALLKKTVQSEAFDSLKFDASIYSMREQILFPHQKIRSNDASVFHSPHYNFPVRAGGLKRVVTVHDIIHLTHAPDLHPIKKLYANQMLKQVVAKADTLLSVSEHSARELKRFFGCDSKKIAITYNAPAEIFKKLPESALIRSVCEELDLTEGEYYVTVGIDKPHKNYSFLVRSLAELWQKGTSKKSLVLVGIPPEGKDYYLSELSDELKKVAANCLQCPGKIAWEKLPAILAGARALLFPSLAEGFGLPIVEAQGVGTPVVAARAASIPEVGGDSVIYFDPTNEENCRQAILQIETGDTLYHQLVEKGSENVKRFQWEKTAEKVLAVYERLQP